MGRCPTAVSIGSACAALLMISVGTAVQAEEYVAGTAPDRRPEAAPRITAFDKSPAWYATARAGIAEPYPASLKFLDDQGGWYTPFTRPGMTGPYDIRGLHAARKAHAAPASAADGAKPPPSH